MAVSVATRPAQPRLEEIALEPIVEAREVDKVYDTGKLQVNALREVSVRGPPRRDGRDHGPERLGQDDAAQLPFRTRPNRRRRGADRGRRRSAR